MIGLLLSYVTSELFFKI